MLNQYRSKNAYYGVTEKGVNVFFSYNTIIAVSYGGITYLTATYYSNTTAHHKTDAVRFYNNGTVIEVTEETLYKIANGDENATAEAISEETKKQLIFSHALHESKYNAVSEREAFIKNTKFEDEVKTQYKNGNYKTVRTYKTTFKTKPNYYILIRNHYFKQTVKPYYGRNGSTTKKTYYTNKTNTTIKTLYGEAVHSY